MPSKPHSSLLSKVGNWTLSVITLIGLILIIWMPKSCGKSVEFESKMKIQFDSSAVKKNI